MKMLPDGHYELKSFATDDKRANIIAYTAFGKRTAPYLLSYDSCWVDRSQGDAVVQWTRDQIEAAKPHSPGGSYLNFPGVGADPRAVREAYGTNYDCLAEIKAKHDPMNMFRMNQKILPSV